MNVLSFNINNERVLKLIQYEHDGTTIIKIENKQGKTENIPENESIINAGDMVMLVNYFRNCKTGIEKSDYINK